jgi:hypothetical protein
MCEADGRRTVVVQQTHAVTVGAAHHATDRKGAISSAWIYVCDVF